MNFKGIEVHALYARHFQKKIHDNKLFYGVKRALENQFKNGCIKKPISLSNGPCQYNLYRDKKKQMKDLLKLSLFNQTKIIQLREQQQKATRLTQEQKKSTFSSSMLLIWNHRSLFTFYMYSDLVRKQIQLNANKKRLKRSKILLKKNKIRRTRNKVKRQISLEHYGFFSMKKTAPSFYKKSPTKGLAMT